MEAATTTSFIATLESFIPHLGAIITYLGAIGFGGIVGVFLNNYFLSRENKKKLLFEARVKAYSGLVSRFFNLFNEVDINKLEEALRYVKINELLSEAYLLGSKEFVENISNFKPNLLAFHKELDEVVQDKKQDENKVIELHKSLVKDIGIIYNQMRQDLFLESVSIDSLQIDDDPTEVFQLRGLSREEIEQRNTKSVEEAIEATSVEDSGDDAEIETEEQVPVSKDNYLNIIPKIENNALDKLETSLGQKINRQVTFAGLPVKFDGAIVNNKEKILRFFEVKVFPALPRNKYGKVMTFALASNLKQSLIPLVEKLSEYLIGQLAWKHILTVVIVINTKSDFLKIRKRIEEIKTDLSKVGSSANIEIKFVFYNLRNMDLELSND